MLNRVEVERGFIYASVADLHLKRGVERNERVGLTRFVPEKGVDGSWVRQSGCSIDVDDVLDREGLAHLNKSSGEESYEENSRKPFAAPHLQSASAFESGLSAPALSVYEDYLTPISVCRALVNKAQESFVHSQWYI